MEHYIICCWKAFIKKDKKKITLRETYLGVKDF